MRECKKCSSTQPIENFYFISKDNGHRSWKCKECTKADVRANYRNNLDYYKDYEKHRSMLPHRVAARMEYQKTESGRIAVSSAKARFRQRNPIKHKAHCALNNAVRDGRLEKMDCCEECGSGGRIHGHHDDYAKPLDVRWLCAACHRQWHAANSEAKNGGGKMKSCGVQSQCNP